MAFDHCCEGWQNTQYSGALHLVSRRHRRRDIVRSGSSGTGFCDASPVNALSLLIQAGYRPHRGKLRNSIRSTTLNTAAVAPMPNTKVAIAVVASQSGKGKTVLIRERSIQGNLNAIELGKRPEAGRVQSAGLASVAHISLLTICDLMTLGSVSKRCSAGFDSAGLSTAARNALH
jgi:hypothetical protein